ncbi:hypothetical protein GFB56_14455 [Ensifer sp. T173]|uniref:Uncharacterized protein n=1 Tax=Ensifer canadensis TaxID=555315 RepID=A0AAW4FIU2_9HYPH|nr:hypothetical protein ASD00_23620 [Ensifer sp. Root31]KQY78695.1 hypothetical protein ASD52_02315 [Ensifer sp. Root142]MBD9487433.1 hypothetical protein [Ensifer sp. ENS11]MBM3092013.1 hypothetical protein [Ensifer canadensis]MDP9633705.1 hypothetical protein [Ensifer adhaerens]PSS65562.1 hypothetical protein C6558_09340 [Ensifer sp. NM-2]
MSIGKPAKDPKTGRFLPRVPGAATPVRTRARKAVRTKLGELFLEDMLVAWESRGAAAIHALIEKSPHDFLKAVASLMPKDVNVNVNQIGEMTDAHLPPLFLRLPIDALWRSYYRSYEYPHRHT